jgi:hypothetical protein
MPALRSHDHFRTFLRASSMPANSADAFHDLFDRFAPLHENGSQRVGFENPTRGCSNGIVILLVTGDGVRFLTPGESWLIFAQFDRKVSLFMNYGRYPK